MAKTSVRIRITKGAVQPDSIAIPDRLRRSLGIPITDSLTIKVGAKEIEAPAEGKQGRDHVWIGEELARRLYLPLPITLRAKWDEEKSLLHFGPVVAVFAVKGKKSRRRSYLFGYKTFDMRILMKHGRTLGVFPYVVTPEGIEADKDAFTAYVRADKRWRKTTVPLPDVVYDRIQSRSWERMPRAQTAKQVLQETPGVFYFNQGFFDKWTLYQKLSDHEDLDRYLPPTRQMAGPASLRNFLQEHPSIFIKPTEGSQGKGIVRIRRRNGKYEWRRGGGTIHTTTRFDSLYKNIQRIQRRRRYIMQPDLRLATFGGAPFDVRILMQKNGSGEWRRTKMYARVAAKGRLTSNISRGGTGMGLGGVLRRRFGKSRRRISRRVRRAARTIINALDEVLDGPLGEVGLDLGVDRRGRVWLIEVNAKPYRKVTDAGPKRQVWLSFRRPMQYARHLAGF